MNEQVTLNDDGSTTVVLSIPVEMKNKSGVTEPVEAVRIKRPTVGDLEVGDKAQGDVAKAIMLLASLSGLPVIVVKRIDAQDFMVLSKVIEGYLSGKESVSATGDS